MDKINSAILSVAPGFWTSEHVLVLVNVILAAAAVGTAIVGVRTIKSSNKVAKSAEDQARSTDASVKAALQQVELGQKTLEQERAALQASIRPLVVDVPSGMYWRENDQEMWRFDGKRTDMGEITWIKTLEYPEVVVLTVPVRNIGPGPAFIKGVQLMSGSEDLSTPDGTPIFDRWMQGKEGRGIFSQPFIDHEVIPTGEMARITFSVGDPESTGVLTKDFAVVVKYSDLSGAQRTQTVIRFSTVEPHQPPGETMFRLVGDVLRVELFYATDHWIPDSEPFVSTGPS